MTKNRKTPQDAHGDSTAKVRLYTLEDRIAFLNLPVAERRRTLAEQAKGMVEHYKQDESWKDIQGGDILEY